jgi:chorismate dehydratase
MNQRIVQVGVPEDVACRPLALALERRGLFSLARGTAAAIAPLLRSRALACGYVSPLEYAREGTDYVAVPGVAFSSHLPSGMLTLHFRQGLRAVSTLAVDPGAAAEIVLAMIVLREQFDARPSVVPVSGSLETMLAKADAALLTGNTSLVQSSSHPHAIDLVEHWVDLTGLPYVHGFWCTRPDVLAPEHLEAFRVSAAEAAGSAPEDAGGLPSLHPDDLEAALNAAAYVFNDDEQDAVTQFLQYAYFHGMLPDVPDLRFVESETDNG